MADKELTVQQGSLYMLRWTTPDTQITSSFVNPDGTSKDFSDPDPPQEGAEPAQVKITVKKGKDEASAQPDRFRKGRTPPFVAKKTKNTAKGKRRVKVFSATFRARQEGVYLFTVEGPEGRTQTQKMTVTPARKVFRTIQDVIDDIFALRRQAILANVADYFPAFNTHPTPGHGAVGLNKGDDSGILDQGPYIHAYQFNGKGAATSCTTVNPDIMRTFKGNPEQEKAITKNNSRNWAFSAGPDVKPGPNKAWVEADKDNIPSVGDTYIVLNNLLYYGHVGIVVHVPPDGNGLWVTADGGQGGPKPTQLALLIPRWGLMGAMLPEHSGHAKLKPDDEGGPYLSGASRADINEEAAVPEDSDIPGIIERVRFRTTPKPEGVSNPRKMRGYVNVDDEVALEFEVDAEDDDIYEESPPEVIEKCKVLQEKVDAVIAAYRGGEIIGSKGT